MKIEWDIYFECGDRDAKDVVDYKPLFLDFQAIFVTEEDAVQFASQFPKSARVYGGSLGGRRGFEGITHTRINLRPTGLSGMKNETGIKRIKTIVRTCEKLGIELARVQRSGNSYPIEFEIKSLFEAL
jgi:hypothetical protein